MVISHTSSHAHTGITVGVVTIAPSASIAVHILHNIRQRHSQRKDRQMEIPIHIHTVAFGGEHYSLQYCKQRANSADNAKAGHHALQKIPITLGVQHILTARQAVARRYFHIRIRTGHCGRTGKVLYQVLLYILQCMLAAFLN